MTGAIVVSASVFAVFGVLMFSIGVWLALRFERANHTQNVHIARFYRDADVEDAADMATDDDR